MKHTTYAKIFRALRNQLLTFGLFALALYILRQIFSGFWLLLAFDICAIYCLILFLVLGVIWYLDHRS